MSASTLEACARSWDPSVPVAPGPPLQPAAPASEPTPAPAPPIGRDPGRIEEIGTDLQVSAASEPWPAMFEAQDPAPQPHVPSDAEVANESLFNLLGNAAWEPSPVAPAGLSPAVASVPVLASAPTTPAPPADRSWVADFDPLFQPNSPNTGNAAGARQADGLAGGTGDAADLGSLWASFPVDDAFQKS